MAAAVSAVLGTYVLVVDDTASIRDALVDLLREHGFAAIGLDDGARALEHLRAAVELPRVIVTDLMMPIVDGWALIAAVRDEVRLVSIPIIAMTASPFASVPRDIPLLRKPFQWKELECLLEG